MKYKSKEATGFVAFAYYREYPRSQEDVGSIRLETIAIKPETTVVEIFNSFWASDTFASITFKPPFKIEILPDQNMIPEDEKLGFPVDEKIGSDIPDDVF